MTEDQKAIRDVLIVSAALLVITWVLVYIGVVG
jgi:hypothetical protein